MPYPTKPRWVVKTVYSLRTAFYSLTLLAGIAAIWLTPNTIADRLSSILTVSWGWMLIVASIVAIFGVAKKLFRFEFAALPFIITGIMIYTVTVIDLAVETPTRLAQAASLSALFVIVCIRFTELLLVTIRLRMMHDSDVRDKSENEDEDASQ